MELNDRALEAIADVFDTNGQAFIALRGDRYLVTQFNIRSSEPAVTRAIAVLLPGIGKHRRDGGRRTWSLSGRDAENLAEMILPFVGDYKKIVQLAFFLEARKLIGLKRGGGYETTQEDLVNRQKLILGYKRAMHELKEHDEVIEAFYKMPQRMAQSVHKRIHDNLYRKRVTPRERGTF